MPRHAKSDTLWSLQSYNNSLFEHRIFFVLTQGLNLNSLQNTGQRDQNRSPLPRLDGKSCYGSVFEWPSGYLKNLIYLLKKHLTNKSYLDFS